MIRTDNYIFSRGCMWDGRPGTNVQAAHPVFYGHIHVILDYLLEYPFVTISYFQYIEYNTRTPNENALKKTSTPPGVDLLLEPLQLFLLLDEHVPPPLLLLDNGLASFFQPLSLLLLHKKGKLGRSPLRSLEGPWIGEVERNRLFLGFWQWSWWVHGQDVEEIIVWIVEHNFVVLP